MRIKTSSSTLLHPASRHARSSGSTTRSSTLPSSLPHHHLPTLTSPSPPIRISSECTRRQLSTSVYYPATRTWSSHSTSRLITAGSHPVVKTVQLVYGHRPKLGIGVVWPSVKVTPRQSVESLYRGKWTTKAKRVDSS